MLSLCKTAQGCFEPKRHWNWATTRLRMPITGMKIQETMLLSMIFEGRFYAFSPKT